MANAKGVDVSHWQSLSDWSTTGLTFVIVKATEGSTYIDPMYAKHVAKGRAAGLIVGAYAFNRDDVDIVAQAKHFAAVSKDADLWFIDVEGQYAFSQAQTKLFMDTFRSVTGKHIGLYHSASGYFDAGQDYDWVAHWGVTQPSRSWDLHQYRGSPLDLDQYNGTAAEMRAWVAALNDGGSTVNSFTVPELRTLAKVKTGAWLYDNSDLNSSSGNIKIDPGRYFVYVGQFSASPDIRIIAYEPTTPDTGTSSKAMFCARDAIESFMAEPDETPFDQADIDEAVASATMEMQNKIDAQAVIIAGLKNDLVVTQAALTQSQAALAEANQTIADQKAVIETLEEVQAEYETLRVALRKAVAP